MSAPEAGAQMGAVLQALKQGGRRILRGAEAAVKHQRLTCSSVLLETASGPAADLIVRQAKKWRADLIVLGTHGRRGVSRLVMGSDHVEWAALAANKTVEVQVKLRGIMGVAIPAITASGEPPRLLYSPGDTAAVLDEASMAFDNVDVHLYGDRLRRRGWRGGRVQRRL